MTDLISRHTIAVIVESRTLRPPAKSRDFAARREFPPADRAYQTCYLFKAGTSQQKLDSSMCQLTGHTWGCKCSGVDIIYCSPDRTGSSLDCHQATFASLKHKECCSTQCCQTALDAVHGGMDMLAVQSGYTSETEINKAARDGITSRDTRRQLPQQHKDMDQCIFHHLDVCLPYLTQTGGYRNELRINDTTKLSMQSPHHLVLHGIRRFSKEQRQKWNAALNDFRDSPVIIADRQQFELWCSDHAYRPAPNSSINR